jgi:hypothetical protein
MNSSRSAILKVVASIEAAAHVRSVEFAAMESYA